MARPLVEFVAELGFFLSESEEDAIPAETVARLQEAIAAAVQELTPQEQTEFLDVLDEMAARTDSVEEAMFYRGLPRQVGIRR